MGLLVLLVLLLPLTTWFYAEYLEAIRRSEEEVSFKRRQRLDLFRKYLPTEEDKKAA